MSRYSQYKIINNLSSELYTSISSSATSVQLNAGQGERRGNEFPIIATLENFDSNGKVAKREIVIITARTGDVLTITRKAFLCFPTDDDNSLAYKSRSFDAGDTISNYIAKEYFDKIKDGFDNVDSSFDDVYLNGTDDLRTYKTTGLGIEVKPGKVLVGSSYYDFAGGNLTLTDNATNYIEIDEDGILVSNTTGRTLENAKISKIITSGGEITSIQDWRLGTVGGKIGGTDIHELTEKTKIAPKDEFIIADSENIYQNKKITAGNLLGIGNGIAVQNISRGNFVFNEQNGSGSNAVVGVGSDSNSEKTAFKRFGNGVQFSSLTMNLAKRGSPTTLTVRIETDDNGIPSGTLIDENAYGSVSGSSLSTTFSQITVNLAGNITIQNGTVCRIVLSIDTVSSSNFFLIGGDKNPILFDVKQFDGTNRNNLENGLAVNLSAISPYTTTTNRDYYYPKGGRRDRENNTFYTACGVSNPTIAKITYSKSGGQVVNVSATFQGNPSRINQYSQGLYGNKEGTTLVHAGGSGQALVGYTLSTPRDFNTISSSYFFNFSISSISGGDSYVYVSNDGVNLYFCRAGYSTVYRYRTNTPRNFSSPTQAGTITASYDVFSNIVDMSDDGRTFINYYNYKIYVYELTTPFDLSTRVLKGTINTTTIGRMKLVGDGDIIFTTNNSTRYCGYVNSIVFDKINSSINADGLHKIHTGLADKDILSSYIPLASIGDYEEGDIAKYNLSYNDNLSNLSVGTKYYLGDDGGVQTTENDLEVGIAIEPTILKLKQDY